MNNKQNNLLNIVDIVVECCATKIDEEGKMSVTRDQVLGKCRSENLIMTRCILCECIIYQGYSVTTAAQLLNRTPSAIRHLLELAHQYHSSSRAFRIAEQEAEDMCESL